MSRRERADGCSLLVRNLSRSVTIDDLRYVAEKYGRLRDVYIPKDYYSGEPRGIGFIEYTDARDAEDAIYGLDRKVIQGKEVSVVLALQGRKRPDDYRRGGGGGGGYGRSPPRRRDSPPRRRDHSREDRRSRSRDRRRSPSRSVSRSPPPRRHRSVAKSDSPPPPRDSPAKPASRAPASRSASPADDRD